MVCHLLSRQRTSFVSTFTPDLQPRHTSGADQRCRPALQPTWQAAWQRAGATSTGSFAAVSTGKKSVVLACEWGFCRSTFLFLLKTDCRTALVSCLCAWDNRKDTILPDASRKRKTWMGIGNASRKAIKKIRKHDIKQYRCVFPLWKTLEFCHHVVTSAVANLLATQIFFWWENSD